MVVTTTLIVIGLIALIWLAVTPGDLTPRPAAVTAARPAGRVPVGPTMYQRLDHAVITAVVEQFCRRLVTDQKLAPYFAHMSAGDIGRLHQHHRHLLSQLLGGPARYSLQDLAAAHRQLHITHDAYWQAVGHLGAVLTGLRVPRDIVVHLLRAMHDVEGYVVNDTAAARAH